MKPRQLFRFFCLLIFSVPLFSEMVVRTKDGRSFRIPVDGADVATIEFTQAASVQPTPSPSSTSSIEGLWDTTIPGSVHVQLEFSRTGTGLSGRFFGRNGWETMADLVVDSTRGTISWRRPLAWAGEGDQRYTARVTGSSMTGVFLPSTSWTGKRVGDRAR